MIREVCFSVVDGPALNLQQSYCLSDAIWATECWLPAPYIALRQHQDASALLVFLRITGPTTANKMLFQRNNPNLGHDCEEVGPKTFTVRQQRVVDEHTLKTRHFDSKTNFTTSCCMTLGDLPSLSVPCLPHL